MESHIYVRLGSFPTSIPWGTLPVRGGGDAHQGMWLSDRATGEGFIPNICLALNCSGNRLEFPRSTSQVNPHVYRTQLEPNGQLPRPLPVDPV